jgi:L-cysteine desulfidase
MKDLKPDDVEKAKQYIEEKRIKINLTTSIPDKLYIEVRGSNGENKAVAVIRGGHTTFTHLEKNSEVLLDKVVTAEEEDNEDVNLTFKKVYEYAVESPLNELEFILEAAKMNKNASLESKNNSYGHNVSKTILSKNGKKIFGDNLHSKMIAATTGACDVRMDGAMVPVMSNSGSGNQGIASTLPVLSFAENIDCTREQLIRALILSSLSMIYIKQYMGRLSALCGCVIASTGSSCGITYLMGGNFEQVELAAKNMIADITGMICDGAKPSCALKIASGVSTATLSALMALENQGVSAQEGIIDEDIDKTIKNLAKIGNKGMKLTDEIVLDIMLKK